MDFEYQDDIDRTYRAISFEELWSLELPPREHIVDPWLPLQGLAMAYANRGVGKTFFALELAMAVASGGQFLNWKVPTPRRVAYLDGEMSLREMQERSMGMRDRYPSECAGRLHLINQETQEGAMPDLSNLASQAWLSKQLNRLKVGLVIVNNLSTLCRSGVENEAESWAPVQSWLLRQRAEGRSVMLIHHAGKSGQQRGTSKREDILDTVIALKRPGDYLASQGARFEVHFEKARGFSGAEAEPLVAQLHESDGAYHWQIDALEATRYEQVVALLNEGMRPSEICDQLGITKGTVSKYKSRARNEGRLLDDEGAF